MSFSRHREERGESSPSPSSPSSPTPYRYRKDNQSEEEDLTFLSEASDSDDSYSDDGSENNYSDMSDVEEGEDEEGNGDNPNNNNEPDEDFKEIARLALNLEPSLLCKGREEGEVYIPSIHTPKLMVQQNTFSNKSTTVVFGYPSYTGIERYGTFIDMNNSKGKPKKALRFKVCDNTCRYNSVTNTLKRNGFLETTDEASEAFNIRWGKHCSPEEFKKLKWFQRVNHFPGSGLIGRKDRLGSVIQKMQREHRKSKIFNIIPDTYNLPSERSLLVQRMKDCKPNTIWIAKPPASSCGRGIRLLKNGDLKRLGKDMKRKWVISKYIENPYTINGYKFDLRVYVLVTSFNPLKVYFYQEGLVRFATQKYSKGTKTLKKTFIHLTNYSINKNSDTYVKNEDEDGDEKNQNAQSSKWSLTALRKYFQGIGIDDGAIMRDIHSVIIKTLISIEADVSSRMISLGAGRNSCFELYGFDVLLDSSLKPWLIEVNISPSLSSSSPLDKRIKYVSLLCVLSLSCSLSLSLSPSVSPCVVSLSHFLF